METWQPCVAGLLTSSLGRLMSERVRKPHRGVWDGKRYIYRFRGKTYRVARLICEAFHGAPPFPTAVCMHKDENSGNNDANNLTWGTQKENMNAPKFLAYCRSRRGDKWPGRR